MIRVLVLVLFITSCSYRVLAQSEINLDSILSITSKIDVDREKLEYLDVLADFFIANNTANADTFFFIRQSLVESLESDDIMPGLDRAVESSNYFVPNFKMKKADALLAPYLLRIDELPDAKSRFIILNTKAAIESEQKKFNEAILYYQQAIDYSQEGQVSLKAKAAVLRSYGKNLVAVGQYGDASVRLNESLKISKTENDSSGIQQTLLELSILFSQLGLYDRASEYVLERQSYIYPPFPLSDAIDDINIGRNLILELRYDEALARYHHALKLGPFQQEYQMLPLYAYNGIVECHYFMNRVDSVVYYFDKTEILYDALARNEAFEFLYLQSRWLYRLSKKQYAKAEQDGLNLYKKASLKNDGAEILMYSKFFANQYQKSSNFDKAYAYEKQYSKIRDSIYTANKTQALLLYQTQFETTEKENTILSLTADNAIQELKARKTRIYFLASLAGLVLLAGFFIMRQYYKNKVERTKQIGELRIKISSDLHDDVGSILTGLAMQSEIAEASVSDQNKPSLAKIAELSRSALSRMRDAVWAMDSRKDNWKSLLDRMHEFANETLEIKNIEYSINASHIDKEKALSADIRQNLYLIYKEAIVNIIKHANANQVAISIVNKANKLQMSIEDNGQIKNHIGTAGQGLSNIKLRAEQIGAKLTLDVENGFSIRVAFD